MVETTQLLWGLLAVTVVSLASLAGGIVLPCINGKSRRLWMHFFIAMAVGTLSSDSMLHLVPEVLGIHSHGSGSHELHLHSHEHNGHSEGEHHDHRARRHTGEGEEHHHHEADELWQQRAVLLKLLCILCAVYVLYFIEFVAFFSTEGATGHGHSHAAAAVDQSEINSVNRLDLESTTSVEGESAIKNHCNSPYSSPPSGDPSPAYHVSPLMAAPPVFCGLRGPAVIIFFGDAVHNFIDGVAIGASFASGFSTGIATSIAVLCHELPHEIGDMAVFLETGLSMVRALSLNLFSALTAYAGLFVGFYAVSIDSAKTWLLALTAGMFLYVAWIDMLAHLKHAAAEKLDPWWITCLLQLAGLFVGTALMFALGWYEHELFGHA